MSSLAIFSESDKLVDCFGNAYKIVRMASDGFCGFHALSYCLTGHQSSYVDIIEDSINVFANMPDIFRLRTNFGCRLQSSLTVNDYASFMHNAIEKVQSGLAIDPAAWCEEGHFISIALLYDLVICTYSMHDKQWYVFNESGSRGYLCLLYVPGHYDVLLGIGGVPVVPSAAHTHGIDRRNFHSSQDAWECLQRHYTFQFVYELPDQFPGITILNNPVAMLNTGVVEAVVRDDRFTGKFAVHSVQVHKQPKLSKHHSEVTVSNTLCKKVGNSCNANFQHFSNDNQSVVISDVHNTNAEMIKPHTVLRERPVDQKNKRLTECGVSFSQKDKTIALHKSRCCGRVECQEVEKCKEIVEDLTEKDAYLCNVQCWTSAHNGLEGLSLHKAQQFAGIHILGYPVVAFHRKPMETVRKDTYAAVVSRPKSVHCCDLPGCKFTGATVQGLQLHKRRVHEVNKSVKDRLDCTDRIAENRPAAPIANKRHHAAHVETIQGRAAVTASKQYRRMRDVDYSSTVPCTTKGLSTQKAKHEMQKSLKDHSNDCINQIAETGTSGKISQPVTVYTEDFAQSAGADTDVVDYSDTAFHCDFPNCTFACSKRSSLNMHTSRIHCKEAVFRCDFHGCDYMCSKWRSLNMHKINIHPQNGTTSTAHAKVQHSKTTASVCDRDNQFHRPRTVRTVNADDAMIVVSLERNVPVASAESEHGGRKRTVSAKGNLLHCCGIKKGRFVCDVLGCGSTHDTPKGLAIHKGRCHKTTERESVMTEESDDASVSTNVSTSSSVRRSARLLSRSRGDIDNSQSNVNLPNMSTMRVVDNASDVTDITTSNACDEANGKNFTITKTPGYLNRKDNVKWSFSGYISECEKAFRPNNSAGLRQQTDPLYDKLKTYHDKLLTSVSNTTTERISREILDVVENVALIDCVREISMSDNDKDRLNELNKTCKLLQPRLQWTWGADDRSKQGVYNDLRMKLCITKECEWKVIECDQCCLLYTSPSPRDRTRSRMPSSA